MKYRVQGTIEYNWEVYVQADSEDEAAELAEGLAEDGMVALGDTVDTPEAHSVIEIPEEVL